MAQQTQERLSIINELSEKAANELGLIVLDVHIGQQGKNKSLAVSIYRKDPAISFSDCEQMSRHLGSLLEAEEAKDPSFIKGSYVLEVLSAGIERQLNSAFEFNVFAGSKVRVTAKEKIASAGTEFIGILLGGDEHSITLNHISPLPNKLAKGQSKIGLEQSSDEKIAVDLQQIYRVCLWPEKSQVNNNTAQ